MNIWNSKTYREDIFNVLPQLDTEALNEKSILITGASGLIGSAIVDLLIGCNLKKMAKITIYAAGRNPEKISHRFSHGLNAGLIPVAYDATQDIHFDFKVDYIIHGASNASPDKYVSEPVDTMLANVTGVNNLLRYAANIHAKKVVYISSSEVYGKLAHGNPLLETEYGNVDILSVRSAYPMGKRAAETLCISYASQFGVDVSIVRPGHIYGPTALVSDNRVSSLFARQAAEGKSLVMKSAGTQIRSYCHCIDCATAVLTVLTRGKNMQAYNISNKNSVVTIRQMAEILAQHGGVELIMDLPTDAEKVAFNPMDNSSLNAQKLEELGWQGRFDAEFGFAHTIWVLKQSTQSAPASIENIH